MDSPGKTVKRPSMDRSWTGWRKGRGEATSRTTTERKRRWRGRGIVEMAVPCRWNGCIARKVTEAMSCGMSCLAEEDWGVGIRRTCVEPWDGVVTGLHTAMRLGKFKNYGTLVTFLAVVHSVRHNPILDWCTWHPNPPPPPLHRCQGRNGQDVAHPAISPSPCCLPTSVSWLEGNVRCVHAPMAPCTSRGLSPYPLAASLGGSFRHALLNSRLTFPLPLPAPTISLLFPSVNSTPRSGPPPHSTPPRTKLV